MATRPQIPFQDPYGGMTIEQARAQGAGSPRAAAPGPGFFERVRLGYEEAGAGTDYGRNQVNWEDRAQAEIRTALRARGYALPDYERGMAQVYFADPGFHDDPRRVVSENLDPHSPRQAAIADRAFWQALDAERRRDPSFLSNYGEVHDLTSLAAHAERARAAELERIGRAAPGGLGFAGVLGQLGHGATDPLSYIPIGGPAAAAGESVARQIVTAVGRQAATNIAIGAAAEPFVRQDAARIGQERTAGDFLTDEAVAGAIGAGFGAVHSGAPHLVDAVTPLPIRVARALGTAAPMATPDEIAAYHVTTRAAEVRQASPFVPGPAGDDEHAQWLDTAMRSATATAPPSPRASAPRAIPRSEAAAGTADLSGTRNPAFEQVKARIRQVESGGNPTIRNRDGSSATGWFQFTDGTWLTYYRRRYGANGSDAQALARRADPAIQNVLMDDLLADDAARLRRMGAPVEAGNLYLLHAAGGGGGEALLRADPNARAIDVYRAALVRSLGDRRGNAIADQAFRMNRWLHGTVGETVRWAHERMGGGKPTPFTAFPEVADAGEAIPARGPVAALDERPSPGPGRTEGEAALHFDDRPVLRPDWFASPEEHARAQLRFEAERDAREGFRRVLPDGDIPFDPYDHLDRMRAYAATRAPLRPEAVAQALGLTAEEARTLTRSLAGQEGAPILVDRNGIARRRAEPAEGPKSLLEFLADRGGIEDANGDYRAMDAQLWHRQAPFRKRLLRERSAEALRGIAESPQHGEDASFAAAIDAGYFPEHAGLRGGAGKAADLPDLGQFREAVDRELRGAPHYTPEDRFGLDAEHQALEADREELIQRLEEIGARHGIELDAATLDDAAARFDAGAGAEAAVRDAIHAAAFRDAPEPAPMPDLEIARFDAPDGEGAKAQMESLDHDLRMDVASDAEEKLNMPFRLDEEGDGADLHALLAEMDEADRAHAEMTSCMVPTAEAAE